MSRPDENRRRRFTLLDAIVLVALVALGIKTHQAVAAMIARNNLSAGPVSASTVIREIRSQGFLAIPVHVTYWFEIAMPWVLTLALSLFVLRLIPPRPRRARLARQLGFAATAMAVGSVLMVWASWLVLLLPLQMSRKLSFMTNWDYPHVFYNATIAAMVAAGVGVSVSWAMLLILGRSRAEADWVEKAGIVLGVILILCLPFYLWDSLLN